MVIFKFLLAYTIVTTWTSTEMVDFTRIYALGSLLLAVFCSTEQSVVVNHSLTASATETTSCKSLGLLLTLKKQSQVNTLIPLINCHMQFVEDLSLIRLATSRRPTIQTNTMICSTASGNFKLESTTGSYFSFSSCSRQNLAMTELA